MKQIIAYASLYLDDILVLSPKLEDYVVKPRAGWKRSAGS